MTDTEFAEYVINKTTKRITLKAKDLPLFEKNVVYMASSNAEVLYIGMSTKGLSRVFGKGHHVLSKIYAQIISIDVYETGTASEARELEAKMINEFRPKHNDRQTFRWYSKQGVSAIIDALA